MAHFDKEKKKRTIQCMETLTKFLLDSGDPQEYKEVGELAEKQGTPIWGSTTNPSLIAKKLAGQKLSPQDAFRLQKELVLEIISLVPGAVSAEVYADKTTTAEEMVEQGRAIASWHKHAVVKLPTTREGFKARTMLRKDHIPVNNTLVFSQQQVFAICLHEQIMQQTYGPTDNLWPSFISPFVGRIDDSGENGIDLVTHGMKIKKLFHTTLPASALAIWMLEASVRTREHLAQGIAAKSELITAPGKIYKEWFSLSKDQQEQMVTHASESAGTTLTPIPYWAPPHELLLIDTEDAFMDALESGRLSITHPLTEKGIERFVTDWQAILS